MGKSMMEQIALLPDEEKAAVLAGVDMDALMWDWSAWARPEQRPPDNYDWNIWLYLAGRGSGKALRVDTPIPTPDGWKSIGEISSGDQVFDERGNICTVLQAHDPYVPERMYEIEFSDGEVLYADGDHQWVTWTHQDRKQYLRYRENVTDFPEDWINYSINLTDSHGNILSVIGPRVRNTDELFSTQRIGSRGDRNHCIPTAKPLNLPEIDLPIEPYVLGYWLGDGESRSGVIFSGDEDLQSLVAVLKNYGYSPVPKRKRTVNNITNLSLNSRLSGLGVLNNKHVPEEYLRSSESQRLELLRGLMDSDGFADVNKNTVEFCSTNKNLALSVLELARSLSERPVLKRSRAMLYGKDCGEKYRVTWRPSTHNPFLLERKAKKIKPTNIQGLRHRHRMIKSVTPTIPVLSRCLTVDSPNSMYLAGYGMIPTHNTRSAAEWIREKAKTTNEGVIRFLLVARTAADVRDVIVEGDSGILNISPPSEKPHYEPSKRRLTWPNGNTALLATADEPDGLRGVQAHYSWADELAAWRQTPDAAGMTSWDNLRVATRLGTHPQIIATTTPKRVPVLYALIEESNRTGKVYISKGSTLDNAGNLSESYLEAITGVYAGTRLAQQELYGEMLDDVEGALWTIEMIEAARQGILPPSAPLRCIGVDPSVAENPRDECGIVVCASTADRDLYKRHAWVLEDATVHGSPELWATKVVEMARRWGAPVIAEVNQGGALVRNAINAIDPNVKVLEVHSKYGKALRAEPVVLAYEQERVHHIGYFADLEAQMTSWIPGETRNSPDRVDALVHAMTALLIKPPQGFLGGKLTAKSPAARRIPPMRQGPTNSGGRGGRVFFR